MPSRLTPESFINQQQISLQFLCQYNCLCLAWIQLRFQLVEQRVTSNRSRLNECRKFCVISQKLISNRRRDFHVPV